MKDFDSWCAQVHAEWERIGAVADGLVGTRNASFGLWELMSCAPSNVRDLHRGLDEQALCADAELAGLGNLPLLPSVTSAGDGPARFWRVLATTLRSLELRTFALSNGSTLRTGAQCRVTFAGRSGYVIPTPPRHRAAKTGDSFRRRGLARSRILPGSLGDFYLDVRFMEDPFPRPKVDGLRMAGGLFAGLVFDFETVEEGFLVRSASAPNQSETILAGVSRADKEDCFAVVFPELCIDRAALEQTESKLGDGTLDLRRIGMILAGSRHEHVGGSYYNVSAVLDRYGKRVGEHRKLFRFIDGSGPDEAIALGDTISVIVVGEIVVAIGICLDFCNASEPSAYPLLDVDYVLVPSCGGTTTMKAHLDRSGEIMKAMRTRCFVVQQHHDEKDRNAEPPVGYVLARTTKDAPDPDTLATSETWNCKEV